MPRPVTAKTILNRAARIVERGWTRGVAARFGNNIPARITDPRAKKFCASGALLLAHYELSGHYELGGRPAELAVAYNAVDLENGIDLISYNDDYAESAEEVARLLRRTARRL